MFTRLSVLTVRNVSGFRTVRGVSTIPSTATLKNTKGEEVKPSEFFANRKVVLIGVPGAFTPVCTQKHLPGYIEKFDDLKKKGVDAVACVTVNDHFVAKAWGESLKLDGSKVQVLADPDASFVKSLGVDADLAPLGGVRSKRFAMFVDDGVVKHQVVENSPGELEVTDATNMLEFVTKE